jgi:UDP-glucose 4-epimerase
MGQTVRILVTGAGGWIGRAVVARLRKQGMDVVCNHRSSTAGEVADAAAMADVVVHAGSGYSNARRDVVDGGLGQAIAVARGCARTDNVVIFLSSTKVYGWETLAGRIDPPLTESAIRLPADNFSRAKVIAEDVLSTAAHRCTILRISNVYGRHIPAKYAIGTMLASALRDGKVVLDCDGTSRRDFISHDDVIDVINGAVHEAVADHSPGTMTYNVASGRSLTLADAAAIVADATGTTVETRGRSPISSPSIDHQAVLAKGWVTRFTDPEKGLLNLMNQWKEERWQPT